MFDIEQAIAGWKQWMLAGGIQSPVPLEELENHLREEIERQARMGVTEARAFEIAAQEIGKPNLLKGEFSKNKRTFMKQIILRVTGIAGVLVGMAFVTPAVAWYRDHGAMPAEHLELLLLGAVMTLAGLGAAIYGFKKRTA